MKDQVGKRETPDCRLGPLDGDGDAARLFDADAFREEVRAFCRNDIPPDIAGRIARHEYFSKDDRVRFQRLLNERGWFAGDWPVEYAGQGWGALQRFILIEELERAGTPWLTHFGISFVGPVIYTFGTEAQKRKHLDAIRNSDIWWCQGFSEPGAGSDLAALETRAVLDGDHYVVSGQKTWTTMAQWADMMFCLVRTQKDERRQQGISFLLIDMQSPGVSVRPIKTIDGRHHINEVFLDSVRVPVADRVGHEGDGWMLAKFIVRRERLLVAELGKARRLIDEFAALGQIVRDGGRPVGASSRFRVKVAELEVQWRALRDLAYACVTEMEQGADTAVDASLLKIRGSEMQQAIHDAIVSILGAAGLALAPDTMTGPANGIAARAVGLICDHLHSRATSIYGGSNEIQRGIVAKAQFGL